MPSADAATESNGDLLDKQQNLCSNYGLQKPDITQPKFKTSETIAGHLTCYSCSQRAASPVLCLLIYSLNTCLSTGPPCGQMVGLWVQLPDNKHYLVAFARQICLFINWNHTFCCLSLVFAAQCDSEGRFLWVVLACEVWILLSHGETMISLSLAVPFMCCDVFGDKCIAHRQQERAHT